MYGESKVCNYSFIIEIVAFGRTVVAHRAEQKYIGTSYPPPLQNNSSIQGDKI